MALGRLGQLAAFVVWSLVEALFHAWLVAYRWVRWKGKYESCDTLTHKILLIGDGFIAGQGDTGMIMARPGLAPRLHNLFASDKRIRQTWHIIDASAIGSVSEDWVPDECVDEMRKRREKKGDAPRKTHTRRHLYHQTFSNAAYSDAEVVVVCLGSLDDVDGSYPKSVMSTLDNVEVICKDLVGRGKRVFIMAPPESGETLGRQRRNKKRNNQLLRYADRNSLGVKLAADLGHPSFRLPRLLAADGVHFNSMGYDRIALEMMRNMFPTVAKLEFQSWKTVFGGTSNEASKDEGGKSKQD